MILLLCLLIFTLIYFSIDFQGLSLPSIDQVTNNYLNATPIIQEIHKAVFSMASKKSPGPDGMSPLFYKTYWKIIGVDVHTAVADFFRCGKLSTAANHTFITLIPKWPGANKVELFKPILLCNVTYKIIIKVLVTRLKLLLDNLIYPNQTAFIPGRSIVDNCIINQEIMAYLNSTKGRKCYMVIKVDMVKAYDKVEWAPLIAILEGHGFGSHFCGLVSECLSSASYSVLVNWSPNDFFGATRGIRQGDPISPTLFTFLADLLSRILARAKLMGKNSGVKITRSSPKISHLMCADDLVIYCQANMEEVKEVSYCLNTYCS